MILFDPYKIGNILSFSSYHILAKTLRFGYYKDPVLFLFLSPYNFSQPKDFEIISISIPLCNAVLQFHPVLVEKE